MPQAYEILTESHVAGLFPAFLSGNLSFLRAHLIEFLSVLWHNNQLQIDGRPKVSDLRIDPKDMQTRSIFRILETVEHLQAVTRHSDDDWLDILQVSWKDYYTFRAGQKCISFSSIERLANHFKMPTASVLTGRVDFEQIALAYSPKETALNERYSVGAHGRMRSTITSIEFLEKTFGWRLKQDILRRFELSEALLQDPFHAVSILLITDICDYLHRRQFTDQDLLLMGTYSFEGNKNTLVGRAYSEMPTYQDAFHAFATTLMPIFERNCTYHFEMVEENTGVVNSISNPDVASELNVKHLGSTHLCHVKNGIWASLVCYFGLTLPKVTHTKCEHRGDEMCQSVFDFSECRPVQGLSRSPLRILPSTG